MFWMTKVTIVTEAPRMATQIARPNGPLLRIVCRTLRSLGAALAAPAASWAKPLVASRRKPPVNSKHQNARGKNLFMGGEKGRGRGNGTTSGATI